MFYNAAADKARAAKHRHNWISIPFTHGVYRIELEDQGASSIELAEYDLERSRKHRPACALVWKSMAVISSRSCLICPWRANGEKLSSVPAVKLRSNTLKPDCGEALGRRLRSPTLKTKTRFNWSPSVLHSNSRTERQAAVGCGSQIPLERGTARC